VEQESGPQQEALFSVVVLFSQIPNLLLKEVYSVVNNKVLYSILALLYFLETTLYSKKQGIIMTMKMEVMGMMSPRRPTMNLLLLLLTISSSLESLISPLSLTSCPSHLRNLHIARTSM